MWQKTREALELFLEKAEKLDSLSFTKWLREKKPQVHYSYSINQPIKIEREGPDQESIDAFLLTFRFFIVGNEMTSFRALAKNVLEDKGLSEHWKQEFQKTRDWVNSYLQTEIPEFNPSLNFDCKPTTHGDVKEIFMNGSLAHTNDPERKVQFETWRKNTFEFPQLENEFVHVLLDLLQSINYIAEETKREFAIERKGK